MREERRVVLDACVLIPMPLADTLLRLAETPRPYSPRWSGAIMDEVYVRDFLAYKAKRDSRRGLILGELTRSEAAEGLYDVEPPRDRTG
jgi:hypothetical protein